MCGAAGCSATSAGALAVDGDEGREREFCGEHLDTLRLQEAAPVMLRLLDLLPRSQAAEAALRADPSLFSSAEGVPHLQVIDACAAVTTELSTIVGDLHDLAAKEAAA